MNRIICFSLVFVSSIIALSLFFFSIHFFMSAHITTGILELEVPPFIANQKTMMQLIGLEDDVKFDVSALYVFGDSVVDSGNNNYLKNESLVANYAPYGVDFDGGNATGRFTNGRTEADFIAQVVGLPLAPPYKILSKEELTKIRTGVNYATGSAGVLPDVAELVKEILGEAVILEEQVDYFEDTIKGLKPRFMSAEELNSFLSRALFFINTADTDMSIGFEIYKAKVDESINIQDYAQSVLEEFSKSIRRLYELGARKFLVNSVGAMGCTPQQIVATKNSDKSCNKERNDRAAVYNDMLSKFLTELQPTLLGSKFVFGDVFKALLDVLNSPASYGIVETKKACCIDRAGDGTTLCAPGKPPCNSRNEYAFFDPHHISEVVHFIFARRCFTESSTCTPINLKELLQA